MIKPANIYYMLAYAFKELRKQNDPRRMQCERFENAADLCAAILAVGVNRQIRQGIRKGYVAQTAALTSLKGKLDWKNSLTSGVLFTNRIVCVYDDFLSNIYLNRIIKTALVWLLQAPIAQERKIAIYALLPYFKDINELNPQSINWRIQYDRNILSYQLLIYISHLVLNGLLQKEGNGPTKIRDYLDDRRMHEIFENFVRNYYRRHFPDTHPKKSNINWALDDDHRYLLPIMQTDVQLTYKNKILIIDTKYYRNDIIYKYNSKKLRSGNLFQIFCYVKNKALDNTEASHEVCGLLLYAKTDVSEEDQDYLMNGNRISMRTLDLSDEFSHIKERLNTIAADFLGCMPSL